MIPLAPDAVEPVIAGEGVTRRALALRHAWIKRRGVFWGDHPRRPTSVVLLRNGIGQRDAFGAGRPDPALAWLARLEGPMALLAPTSWAETVRRTLGPLNVGSVESRFRPEGAPAPSGRRAPGISVRRLDPEDAPAFETSAPSWSLLGWNSASELIVNGAAFGVDLNNDPAFAALAWIQESAGSVDLIGVWVDPRFRRLGLGLAVAGSLVDHVVSERRSCPLWALSSTNHASRSLALALGFTLHSREPLWRWGKDSTDVG